MSGSGPSGRPPAFEYVAAAVPDVDSADHVRARRHLDLAREVAEQVGGSLDVVRTAQDVADVLAPA
ncbi:hypothetical protein ACFRCW_47170, partial [Streptomyces sp. NPDC056653]